MRSVRRTMLMLAALLLFGCVGLQPAYAQTPTYTIIDLGEEGAFSQFGIGINKQGVVVGSVDGALAWWDAALGLQLRPDLGDSASGINNVGQIVGTALLHPTYQVPDDIDPSTFYPEVFPARHAVLISSVGELFDLGTLGLGYGRVFGGPLTGFLSEAHGINDEGVVVGFSLFTDDNHGHAFISVNGVISDLGQLNAPSGAVGSVAYSINGFSEPVGASVAFGDPNINSGVTLHAVIWGFSSSFPILDLGTLPGDNVSEARSINDAEQVVGTSYDEFGGSFSTAFIWDFYGGIRRLGTLAGRDSTWANAINNNGQVVGGADDNVNPGQVAILSDLVHAPGQIYDLNTLIPANSGWVLTEARAINDNGEITGLGTLNGVPHTFLLRPVTSSTPGGSDIKVTPSADTTLLFSNISVGGTTTVTTVTNPPSVPPIYQGVSVAVDIASTATFTGPVQVCVAYDPAQFTDPSLVRLLHYVNGAWQDITTSVNTTSHLVCGTTMSFSPFVLTKAKTVSWSGLLQPVNTDGSSVFKLGSTVPVKFNLTGADTGKTNLIAKLYVSQKDTVEPTSVNEADSTAAADTGNTFRRDSSAGSYIFNLSTKYLSKGTWYMRVDLGDGSNNIVQFKLK